MSLVRSASSIPHSPDDEARVAAGAAQRGGEAEPTRRMSPELQAMFNRAFQAWERRQEQLTIWETA